MRKSRTRNTVRTRRCFTAWSTMRCSIFVVLLNGRRNGNNDCRRLGGCGPHSSVADPESSLPSPEPQKRFASRGRRLQIFLFFSPCSYYLSLICWNVRNERNAQRNVLEPSSRRLAPDDMLSILSPEADKLKLISSHLFCTCLSLMWTRARKKLASGKEMESLMSWS